MEPEFAGEGLSMMDELELSDLRVREAAIDEEETMFNPDEHPKPPSTKEEGVTDLNGDREVDLMFDTPSVDVLTLDGDIDVM